MRQEVSEEIKRTAKAVVNEIHTALPGEIVSFDTGTGTATVKPIGKFVTSDKKSLEYPQLTEVPLVFPFCQQAGVGIAFPVIEGDSCIIIISEVELDEWRSGAESEGSLRYDLTNAVAIPGLLFGGAEMVDKAVKKNAVVIGAPDVDVFVSSEGVDVSVGDTTFTVSETGIAIGGDLTVTGNISYTESIKKVEIENNESQVEEV